MIRKLPTELQFYYELWSQYYLGNLFNQRRKFPSFSSGLDLLRRNKGVGHPTSRTRVHTHYPTLI